MSVIVGWGLYYAPFSATPQAGIDQKGPLITWQPLYYHAGMVDKKKKLGKKKPDGRGCRALERRCSPGPGRGRSQ